MRRIFLLLTVAAIVVVALAVLAAPAIAQNWGQSCQWFPDGWIWTWRWGWVHRWLLWCWSPGFGWFVAAVWPF